MECKALALPINEVNKMKLYVKLSLLVKRDLNFRLF